MNWIKTSERLPDDGQEVIAYYGGARVAWEDPDASRFAVMFCGPIVGENHERIGTYWSNDEHSVPAPTHWQPLPAPPSDAADR